MLLLVVKHTPTSGELRVYRQVRWGAGGKFLRAGYPLTRATCGEHPSTRRVIFRWGV